MEVSIHTPPRGRDQIPVNHPVCSLKFQSTRPRGGVTLDDIKDDVADAGFNPHAPAGA